MSKNKSKRDIISEQQFNRQAAGVASLDPESDSPGDSDDTFNEEFEIGLNFMPDEKNEYEDDDSEEVIYADDNSKAPSEVPGSSKVSMDGTRNRIPKSAQVVSSGMPKPIEDLDSPSDTH